MADTLKGVWTHNNGGYSSTDSETESDNELSSIYGVARPSTPLNAFGNGKIGSENIRSCTRSQASRKRNGEERMPTRRPDPKVLNRNALLARENRRKKKLYLESVESELHGARKANRALVKALKRQVKLTQRLEQEKRYFQKILANQTEISNLVASFNKKQRQVSIDQLSSATSLDLFNESPNREQLTSCCSSSSYDPEPLQSPFGAASHDLDADMTGTYSPSSWDEIWNAAPTTTQPLGEETTLEYPQTTTLNEGNYNNISIEDHNYVSSVSADKEATAISMPLLSSDASSSDGITNDEFNGFCLHLTRARPMLESIVLWLECT